VITAEQAIGATYFDDRYFASLAGLWGAIARRLPYEVAQVAELLARGGRYDAVLTWSDRPAMVIAGVMRIWPRRPAHVAILMWPSRPKKALPLRLVHRGIDRILAAAPLQRAFLHDTLGIDSERLPPSQGRVDLRFWRPMDGAGDTICSVGQEMRDYETLLEALAPLRIPCHIAVGSTLFGVSNERRWKDQLADRQLPDGLTVGHRSLPELRELYARSRCVVVPLVPSDNDSGINTIMEACAMGKAIVCTASPGQVGVLQDGVNCLRVPAYDAAAMRSAIERLWNDPALAARLGAAARETVQRSHGLDRWTATLERAVGEAVAVRAAAGRRRTGPIRPLGGIVAD